MGVDTGADRCRAQCEPLQAWRNRREAERRVLYLRLPGVHLLADRDGQGIHQVRAPRLYVIADLGRLVGDRARELGERRQQRVAQLERCREVDRGRDDVVAALATIDMVIRVHGAAEPGGRQAGDHLVGIHVRAGAGAGLHDADRELVGMLSGRDLERGRRDRRGELRLEFAEFAIGLGRSPLDQAEGADQRSRHGQAADLEILDCALGLGAP